MNLASPLYPLALSAGLLGGGHCLGMCGGLISALSIGVARRPRPLAFQLLYHLGRLTTYTLIGGAVGWLGSVLAYANAFHGLMRLALVGSDLFVILIGLGSAGLFRGARLMDLEFRGPAALVGRAAAVLSRRPAGPLIALPLGLLMGFLPCGLSYAIAITAAQTASPLDGGLVMLCFGLGTVPLLLLFGSAIDWLGQRARQSMLRAAGLLVAVIGGWHLYRHLALLGWNLAGPLSFFCH